MARGRRPEVWRWREAAAFRAQGLTLAQVGVRLGISRQAVAARLAALQRHPVCGVACAACGGPIFAAVATREDADTACCVSCLRRPGMTVAQRLKGWRLAAELTRAELARAAGVGRMTLALAERGSVHPHRKTLQKLAGILGVPVSEFGLGADEEDGNRRALA